MKLFSSIFLLTLLSCASPKVFVKYDEFKGGKVVKLSQNQLNTPGHGDIYFNLEAIINKKSLELIVIGAVDYEMFGTGNMEINQTDPLSILIDGKKVELKPIMNTHKYSTNMGVMATLHTQTQNYQVTKKQLEQIANGKTVKVKMFSSSHRDGGFVGTFEKRNSLKLKEFLSKL